MQTTIFFSDVILNNTSLFRFFCSCKRNDELLRTLSEKKPSDLSETLTENETFLLLQNKRTVSLHDFSKLIEFYLIQRNFHR